MEFYINLWKRIEQGFFTFLLILLGVIFFVQILYSFPGIRKHLNPVEKLEGQKTSLYTGHLTS